MKLCSCSFFSARLMQQIAILNTMMNFVCSNFVEVFSHRNAFLLHNHVSLGVRWCATVQALYYSPRNWSVLTMMVCPLKSRRQTPCLCIVVPSWGPREDPQCACHCWVPSWGPREGPQCPCPCWVPDIGIR